MNHLIREEYPTKIKLTWKNFKDKIQNFLDSI